MPRSLDNFLLLNMLPKSLFCMGVLKKLKTEVPYDPAIPLLGIYPKGTVCYFEGTHAP